jgi:hypothetical protein
MHYHRAMSKSSNAVSINPTAVPDEIVTIRMELIDTEPLICREVIVPTSITLRVLHDVIQTVMGWFDYHLWEFTVGETRYGPPLDDDWGDSPRRDAAKTRLKDVLGQRRTVIDYIYDFGDSWEMRLVAQDVREGEFGAHPSYAGGEGAAPPEDCGGLPGFYNLLDALADEDHPDHEELSEFFEEYDPRVIDGEKIEYGLSRIARARKGGKRPGAKKKAP